MHKSALTFGLLASSLVMLAVMPFLNQNNSFSNVMAQGYNPYNEYPTKDYKYECRTGPFEGFFVSSVEFCLAFDDDDKKKKKDRPIVEPPIPPTQPPTPPTPQTASLTINKAIFGCNNIVDEFRFFMNCLGLQNDDPRWLSCDNSIITNTDFCRSLNENSFDIEVNESNNNQQIAQFKGSAVGTTIPNLQPGTYTVNEIKYPNNINQLGENLPVEATCVTALFTDGGYFNNQTLGVNYPDICFEYEDQQGNNCNTITLAAGEHKTCTVKNYIRAATNQNS